MLFKIQHEIESIVQMQMQRRMRSKMKFFSRAGEGNEEKNQCHVQMLSKPNYYVKPECPCGFII